MKSGVAIAPERRLRVLLIMAEAPVAAAMVARPELDVTLLADDTRLKLYETAGCGVATASLPYDLDAKLSPRAIRRVWAAIRRYQPDLVHAFKPRCLAHTVLATMGMRPRPKIVSYRGVTARSPWWSLVQRITYQSRRVDAHACESIAVQEALVASGVRAERRHVVYNSLPGPLERCSREEAHRAWGVPANAFVVATVANMRQVKGADVLLQAALECTHLDNLYFVLAGRVLDRRVERLARDPRIAERVRLLGYRADAARLASAADVFVMPSRSEALCVAVLESMAQGLCTAVSDAGGMKEAVRHEREGLVFPRENAPQLAVTLHRLHGDDALRARLGAAARRRFVAEFTPASMAERLVTLYREVAQPWPRIVAAAK